MSNSFGKSKLWPTLWVINFGQECMRRMECVVGCVVSDDVRRLSDVGEWFCMTKMALYNFSKERRMGICGRGVLYLTM